MGEMLNRNGSKVRWPLEEARAMALAAAGIHSAVALTALGLDILGAELEEGKHRGKDGRRQILALVKTCALRLQQAAATAEVLVEAAGAAVSREANRASGEKRLKEIIRNAVEEGEIAHADQP